MMTQLCTPIAAFIAVLATFSFSGVGYSFHGGGENYCQGCHVIHNPHRDPISGENDSLKPAPAEVRLIGSDPSSTCLRCHAGKSEAVMVLSRDGSWLAPGGDFYWLKKTFGWHAAGHYMQSEADRHGHNIVAIDYDLAQDSKRPVAPGGAYPAADLGCDSCHDPHGKSRKNSTETGAYSPPGFYGEAPEGETGNYRLLGGAGYRSGRSGSGHTFTHGAPIALASPSNWVETDANHTAYGSGMSKWCGNCHVDYIRGHTIGGRKGHPAGENAWLSSELAANYNAYMRAGDLNGNQARAYLSLVPFETGDTDAQALNPYSTAGPSPRANVMCLTCHRAHASAFEYIGRWDFGARFVADAHPRAGDAGVAGNDVQNSFYGREMTVRFGRRQGQFCNKCHLKD